MLVVNEDCTHVIDATCVRVKLRDERFEIAVVLVGSAGVGGEGVVDKGFPIASYETEDEANSELYSFVKSKDPLYFVNMKGEYSKSV